jgi:hypothetical protein
MGEPRKEGNSCESSQQTWLLKGIPQEETYQ